MLRVLFKFVLTATLLLPVFVASPVWAQFPQIESTKQTVLAENNGVKIKIHVNLEYPKSNAEVHRKLSKHLFGSEEEDITVGLKKYLDKFQNYKVLGPLLEEPSSDIGIEIGSKYHGAYGYVKLADADLADYYKMMDRYMPFYYYLRSDTDKEKLTAAGITADEIKGVFTYDQNAMRMLNVTDVFTDGTIAQLHVDKSRDNEEILIRAAEANVAYSNVINGMKVVRELSIGNNPDAFTENIRRIPELNKRYNETQETGINGIETSTAKVFDIVEQMPAFPGGDGKLMEWLSRNMKYPYVAEKNGVQGRVIVRFVVGKDGSISNVSVVRSVDPSLDREALRVVRAMPRWIPGRQEGKPVPVWFTWPVTFQLK